MKPTKLEDFVGEVPEVKKSKKPGLHLSRELISGPIPDPDGKTYFVTRKIDGKYLCKDQDGNDCMRRTMHGYCHHVEGQMLAWENVRMPRPKPKKFSKKYQKAINMVRANASQYHDNSGEVWSSDQLQELLPDIDKVVLIAVAENPGATRHGLCEITHIHWNTLTPAVHRLKNAEFIVEGENIYANGHPRSTLFLNIKQFKSTRESVEEAMEKIAIGEGLPYHTEKERKNSKKEGQS